MRAGARASAVGNYVLTGRALGKGHFARVEEATHSLLHHKVAIKVIDLTCIREEYARRNLHREPQLMARLGHPCIAALYETMMHGPRLYVVMEAATGGDLSALVLAARGARASGGLPERRARALAAQLVSAVRHMHERGVVHRDLKMENIMLDGAKQFIKIVDFGLSNVWTAGGGLRTPCGSLEYAAPELLAPSAARTRRYGPPLDLWSIGVIVYGMVTGALPFTAPERAGRAAGAGGDGRDRPQLRQMIARGLGRKQRAALTLVSPECNAFVSRLLEPRAEARMTVEEAACHGWLREGAAGRRLRAQPLAPLDRHATEEIYQRIAMLCESDAARVAAQISAEPYGPVGGMYRIEARRRQLAAVACAGGVDALWHRPRPPLAVSTHTIEAEHRSRLNLERKHILTSMKSLSSNRQSNGSYAVRTAAPPDGGGGELPRPPRSCERFVTTPLRTEMSLKQNTSQTLAGTNTKRSPTESGCSARLRGCPPAADLKRTVDYHSRTGDGLPSWHSSSVPSTPLAKAPTPIRRPSIGYIVNSKHPIDNQSKNENGTTVVWSKGIKEPAHLQFRRNVHPKRPLV